VPFEALRDPEAIANWPTTFGRDGARTPMPWVPDKPHAGFSAASPWLPVDQTHLALSVEAQNGAEDSVLDFYRTCIALRKHSPALRAGELAIDDDCHEDLLILRRSAEGDVRIVMANVSAQPLPVPDRYKLLQSIDLGVGLYNVGDAQIAPFSGVIATPQS